MSEEAMKTVPTEERKVTIHISIPKEAKMDIDLSNVDVDQDKTVTLKGKVTSVSHDSFGKSFGMDISSISFSKESSTMKEQMKEIKESRKV